MKGIRTIAVALVAVAALPLAGRSQTWTPLTHQPSFEASTALLLTDGTVMVQAYGAQPWWRLTPDNTGSYLNGTWTELASLPSGYGPLYYSSAVLTDGRVLIEGGEYNFLSADWTTKGAIYSPVTNAWTSVNPPSGWTTIGDAQNVVLPNGQFLLANCCTTEAALFNSTSLTWTTAVYTGKADSNDEEGWNLLPDGTVLTVDTNNTKDLTNSERYFPNQKWQTAGSTIVKLPDTDSNGGGSHEMGPGMLRPDGTVFEAGATGATAIYTPPAIKNQPGTWAVGPSFPDISGQGQLDIADGPAALLPDGNVLCAASPGIYNAPTHFYEFDGTNLNAEPATPNASKDPSYVGRMLLLPTGQVLYTDGTTDVEVYTAAGTYQTSWAPTITTAPATVTHGKTYSIRGTQFNGLSQANAYGDDAQAATNYPLVRIVNKSTGHVFYAKTHNFSTMGVATKTTPVSAQFDVPTGIETGASTLYVVTNSIPSTGVAINVN